MKEEICKEKERKDETNRKGRRKLSKSLLRGKEKKKKKNRPDRRRKRKIKERKGEE